MFSLMDITENEGFNDQVGFPHPHYKGRFSVITVTEKLLSLKTVKALFHWTYI